MSEKSVLIIEALTTKDKQMMTVNNLSNGNLKLNNTILSWNLFRTKSSIK